MKKLVLCKLNLSVPTRQTASSGCAESSVQSLEAVRRISDVTVKTSLTEH